MLPTRLGSPQVPGMPHMSCHRRRSDPRGCLPGEHFLRQVDFLLARASQWAILRQWDRVADHRSSGVDPHPGDEPTQEVSGP